MQKGYDIKEAWNDIYKDEVINSKADPEKVENWMFISSNKDIIGVDDEKKNIDDELHIMMIEQARDSKASLNDNVDAFGKQQSKIKQEKGDKKYIGTKRRENEETS